MSTYMPPIVFFLNTKWKTSGRCLFSYIHFGFTIASINQWRSPVAGLRLTVRGTFYNRGVCAIERSRQMPPIWARPSEKPFAHIGQRVGLCALRSSAFPWSRGVNPLVSWRSRCQHTCWESRRGWTEERKTIGYLRSGDRLTPLQALSMTF